jgi:phospholipid/cholesterol/gamma-HCH transport system permease protein
MIKTAAAEPGFTVESEGETRRIALSGAWTIKKSRALEEAAGRLAGGAGGAKRVAIDFSGVQRLDTAGAWLIDKARAEMAAAGATADYAAMTAEQRLLMGEAAWFPPAPDGAPKPNLVYRLLDQLGHWAVTVWGNIYAVIAFLGELTASALRVTFNPKLARPTSMVFHLQSFALRAMPIIVTINFLVGCIVEQQGIFQLRRFGAPSYAIDLIGVLTLRELGVLLTSIMIAGRSGSAITAEIGSMKMREEIDALRVMGMSPMEVLVMPRMLALIVALPLMTFIADIAALAGGMLTAWIYADISPQAFVAQLRDAIGLNTFLVGLIKSPFMALAIGMIACIEGFRVQGSAESLGRRVTDSVVNAIFMVILVDGMFAIFFAGIHY